MEADFKQTNSELNAVSGEQAAEKRQICIMLPPVLIEDLKVLAIRQRTSVSALLEAAAQRILEARPE